MTIRTMSFFLVSHNVEYPIHVEIKLSYVLDLIAVVPLLTWCIVLIQTQAKQAFPGTENPALETIKPTPGGKEGSVINNVLVEDKNRSQIEPVDQQL